MFNFQSHKYLTNLVVASCAANVLIFKNLMGNFSLKLQILDEVSRKICYLLDHFAVISTISKPSEEHGYVENILFDQLNRLNSDVVLYNGLLEIKYHEKYQFLNSCEKQILDGLIRDYEGKYGILQGGEVLQELLNREKLLQEELQKKIFGNQEIIEIPVDIVPILNKISLKNVKFQKNENGNLEIHCNYRKILILMSKLQDFSLRKWFFQLYLNSNAKNKSIIASLLKTRAAYADKIKPTQTFAEFSLRTNSLFGKFSNVFGLLDLLKYESTLIRLNLAKEFKKRGISINDISDLFIFLLKSNEISKETPNFLQTIQWVSNFFKDLINIQLDWTFGDYHLPSTSIKTIVFTAKLNNTTLGTIEILLTPAVTTQTMINRAHSLINYSELIRTKPKMYLVFENLPTDHENPLSITQIRNIVHEMTHALHNLLSCHDFQFISNSTSLDFAEIMAVIAETLFIEELYTKKPELKDPDFDIKKSIEQLEQIYFSMIDLRFHNEIGLQRKPLKEIIETMEEINWNTFNEVFGEFNPTQKKHNYYCSMLHLATYPSMYFPYALGAILAEEVRKRRIDINFRGKMTKMLSVAHYPDIFYLRLQEIIC